MHLETSAYMYLWYHFVMPFNVQCQDHFKSRRAWDGLLPKVPLPSTIEQLGRHLVNVRHATVHFPPWIGILTFCVNVCVS